MASLKTALETKLTLTIVIFVHYYTILYILCFLGLQIRLEGFIDGATSNG